MAIASLIDTAIQDLQQDPNCTRIRKLMLYACTNQWESHPDRLANLDLQPLIKNLLELTPTQEQLRSHLYNLVGTLNKSAEYTLVANAIIKHLKALYSQMSPPEETSNANNAIYRQLGDRLERDPEQLRIRKLLYCACRNSWQNDPNVLMQHSLAQLVQETHAIAPTPSHLHTVLTGIVKTLNRQNVYSDISQRILKALIALYQPGATRMMTAAGLPMQQPTTATATNTVGLSESKPTPPKPAIAVPTQVISSEEMEAEIAAVRASLQPPPIADDYAAVPQVNPPQRRSDSAQKQIAYIPLHIDWSGLFLDLFDAKLAIVKYTTPLRAKILLFSMLRQVFDNSPQAYAHLREHDLGSLIQELLQTYQTLPQIEGELRRVSRLLDDPQAYLQASSAILRAIRPLCHKLARNIPADGLANSTDPTAMRTNEAELTALLDSEDHTDLATDLDAPPN